MLFFIFPSVDILGTYGTKNTALHLAAYRGHPEAVKLLLGSKADPTLGNENQDLPTHLAALGNHVDCINILLDATLSSYIVDINAHDAQGYCALHYACGEGHTAVARYLLTTSKAETVRRNNDGLTPIMCAVQQGHRDVTSLLLEHDPGCMTHTNNSGDSCLHYATISQAGVGMIELLLRHGVDPFAKNNDGLTPLHEAIIEKHADSAQMLKSVMAAMRADSKSMSDATLRRGVVAAALDATGGEKVQEKSTCELPQEDQAPPPTASTKKPRSKFSSTRADNGMRAKTSIEIAKEEAAAGSLNSGIQGKAPPAKTKSRILAPGSSAAFGGF